MNSDIKIIEIIKNTIEVESQAIRDLQSIDFDPLLKCIHVILSINGRVIATGIGKSAIAARKLVATLNSTGTPSVFLHTADALHGDVGVISNQDVLIIISKSGESQSVKDMLPIAKKIGVQTIAFVSKADSFLAREADISVLIPIAQEADLDNLAPTASTLAHITIGDALAMALKHLKGFNQAQFANLHPGGLLGKKLNLTVRDLASKNPKPIVKLDDKLSHIITEISSNRLGACCVVDTDDLILGVITDGDIRRLIEQKGDIYSKIASDIMSSNPKTVSENTLAEEALVLMKQYSITQLVVMNENRRYSGIIHIHDIINEGFS